MSAPATYLLSYDVDGTVARYPTGHLTGGHLTAAQLDHAEFIVVALNGPVAVGIIIGERPTGIPAFNWVRHVGDVLELGGLNVDPAFRRTAVARRLSELAVDETRALNRTPVAVTETGSVSHRALTVHGADHRKPFTVDGRQYTPWVLT